MLYQQTQLFCRVKHVQKRESCHNNFRVYTRVCKKILVFCVALTCPIETLGAGKVDIKHCGDKKRELNMTLIFGLNLKYGLKTIVIWEYGHFK